MAQSPALAPLQQNEFRYLRSAYGSVGVHHKAVGIQHDLAFPEGFVGLRGDQQLVLSVAVGIVERPVKLVHAHFVQRGHDDAVFHPGKVFVHSFVAQKLTHQLFIALFQIFVGVGGIKVPVSAGGVEGG